MPDKASSSGMPTSVTTATGIYGSQAPCILPVLTWFLGPPTNLNGEIFATGKSLSSSILYFVNHNTVGSSSPYFTSADCDVKDTSFDEFYTSFYLHDDVVLLFCDIMSHSHIILSEGCNITSWYCNSSYRCLYTMWGTLASGSNVFESPLIVQNR